MGSFFCFRTKNTWAFLGMKFLPFAAIFPLLKKQSKGFPLLSGVRAVCVILR